MFFPPNPIIGQQWGNYTWDGVKWVCGSKNLSPGCSSPGWFNPISIAAVAPIDSDLWFNTSTNLLQVFASVGVSPPQWVGVSATVITGAQPHVPPITTSVPAVGQLWIDDGTAAPSTPGWLRCFEGSVWREICQPLPGLPVPTGNPPIAISMTVPASPPAGQLWLNPTGPTLSQFLNNAWVTIGTRPMRRVKIIQPPGAIETTATWSIGAVAGDWFHVAGMRGIDPVTNLQPDPTQGGQYPYSDPSYGLNRAELAFSNMLHVAASQGCDKWDCVRVIASVVNMQKYRPLINKVQGEIWGPGHYPPRRIITVAQLNGSDQETEPMWTGQPTPTVVTPAPGVVACPRGDIMEIEGYFFRPCC